MGVIKEFFQITMVKQIIQKGDRVKVKSGHPRAGEIGTCLEFKYLPIPDMWAWLVDFGQYDGDKGWYPIKNLVKQKGASNSSQS